MPARRGTRSRRPRAKGAATSRKLRSPGKAQVRGGPALLVMPTRRPRAKGAATSRKSPSSWKAQVRGGPAPSAVPTAGAKPDPTAARADPQPNADPTPAIDPGPDADVKPDDIPTPYILILRYVSGTREEEIELEVDDRTFYPFVQKWRYVVANRRRITRATRDSLSENILSWIRELTDTDETAMQERIKQMAAAGLVEVKIPYTKENVGWSARLFPWESALWLLTSPYRSETSDFTVVRHLECTPDTPFDKQPVTALVVRSGPGELGSIFELTREVQMVAGALADHMKIAVLTDPDRGELKASVTKESPSIVHLAGVDPYALEATKLAKVSPDEADGFVLRGLSKGYDCVSPAAMAEIVNSGAKKPLLVAISSCFGAPRVGALATALGAQHAIGFLDMTTDAEAMLFFSVFYRIWSRDWNILDAFRQARREWMGLQTDQPTQRSGVVLWSRKSLVQLPAPKQADSTEVSTTAETQVTSPVGETAPNVEEVATPHDLQLHIALVPDKVSVLGHRDQRSTSLNYSLLHNDRSPFSIFTVEKFKAGKLPPLQVEVALEVGNEVCRCRFSEQLPEGPTIKNLLPSIRLPLVAGLLRQCSESLRTNLYVRIECDGKLLRESSDRVTVLPADEWRDDGEDHRWLPSFVLPRDPAVLRIVTCAQRYLRTLLDDCDAGFKGYQDLADDDSNAADIVDSQVQAIWAALQHELPLSYINPPPSYTSQSQRLRTPSEIFKGNAATCIDLALLFASCLEFVGIFAAVFLISGHAFPGYWRSDKVWWNMKKFRFEKTAQPSAADSDEEWRNIRVREQSAVTQVQSEGWMFAGVDNLAELMSYVQSGALVPFESTYVALRRSFVDALEQGSSNLHPQTFDAMVDIQSARSEQVTPLPLLDRLA
jgi:hypothetical protein